MKSFTSDAGIEIPEEMWEELSKYLENDLADAIITEELGILMADEIKDISDDVEVVSDLPIFDSEDFEKEMNGLLKDGDSIEHIKPESSDEDGDKSDIQQAHQKEINGQMHYYDDNGKLYRVDNNLQPNSEYDINGYHYVTDEEGRITSAEGKLHLKNREERLPIKDSIDDIGKGDQLPGDDRGHLIGDQFDGSNGLENMIPQNADINRNDFRNFENELAKEVKSGNEVYYKVEPIYDGDSKRPSALCVSYTINGVEGTKLFPNNPKG